MGAYQDMMEEIRRDLAGAEGDDSSEDDIQGSPIDTYGVPINLVQFSEKSDDESMSQISVPDQQPVTLSNLVNDWIADMGTAETYGMVPPEEDGEDLISCEQHYDFDCLALWDEVHHDSGVWRHGDRFVEIRCATNSGYTIQVDPYRVFDMECTIRPNGSVAHRYVLAASQHAAWMWPNPGQGHPCAVRFFETESELNKCCNFFEATPHF